MGLIKSSAVQLFLFLGFLKYYIVFCKRPVTERTNNSSAQDRCMLKVNIKGSRLVSTELFLVSLLLTLNRYFRTWFITSRKHKLVLLEIWEQQDKTVSRLAGKKYMTLALGYQKRQSNIAIASGSSLSLNKYYIDLEYLYSWFSIYIIFLVDVLTHLFPMHPFSTP